MGSDLHMSSCGYCQGLSQELNGIVENCLNGTRERGLSSEIIWDKLLKVPPTPDTQFTGDRRCVVQIQQKLMIQLCGAFKLC